MRVLDLGGDAGFWRAAPVRPLSVTMVNLFADCPTETWLRTVQGDACEPPREVSDARFDLVVSNSLLEHVGGHARRAQLADVIERSADRHWVQTPHRYFPVEPHWLFPGIQFLPFSVRVLITEKWPVGNVHPTTHLEAVAAVHEVELIGKAQMHSYFPDSEIWTEKLAGLPKSLVAVRA